MESLSKSLTFTSRHSARENKISTPGWAELVDFLETVAESFPNFSANHLLVYFSLLTTFILLKSLSIVCSNIESKANLLNYY